MIKFSNKTFYNRHNNEMSKYINKKNALHIVNQSSAEKVHLKECETIFGFKQLTSTYRFKQ